MPKINVTELDFDNIKDNLKSFLQSQSEFSDFDFDGSGMDVLLDLLAYNSHYMAVYGSFLGNEMFLDSADIRESIVSNAKTLGYTPKSRTSPKAKLDIVWTPPTSPSSITVLKNTKWTGVKDGKTYSFVNLLDTTVLPVLGVYSLSGLEIFEGDLLSFEWTVDSNIIGQRFVIPNNNIDTSTISVNVQKSATDLATDSYSLAGNSNKILGTSKVYFLQEVEDSKFEICFGNGVVGNKLEDGNIIKIDYLVTKGEAANDISLFTANASIGGLSAPDVTFTTSQSASGGGEKETNESIKFLAPKNYSTQGRAVTITDYQNILLDERSDIETITGWGGEDAVPPQFGRAFLAIKPKGLDRFSNSDKQDIIDTILKTKNVASITPVIVDADLTYFNITSIVKYNAATLTTTTAQLTTDVQQATQSYFSTKLNKFQEPFRHSALTGDIDDSNQAVLNNETTVILEKRYKPDLGVTFTRNFNFNNPIKPGTVISNSHTSGGTPNLFLVDDSKGKLDCVTIVGESGTVESIAVTNGGKNYISAPNVKLVGGGGSGATATAVLSGSVVSSITIDNKGTGYEGAPNVVISEGGGTGATATATLGGVQTIVANSTGTVDYVKGVVTVILSIDSYTSPSDDRLKIFVSPSNLDINTLREQVLTLDVDDVNSIKTILIAENP